MSIYRRFFVSSHSIDGHTVDLTEQYQHIAKVLRMRVGDTIVVCCGDGIEHMCTIDSIDSHSVVGSINDSQLSANENSYYTTLYLAVLKGDKNDLVVQKAVELGVNRIVLFESKYTVSDVKESKLSRLSRIALEAGKQCGRAVTVEVEADTLSNIDWSTHDMALLCYERAEDNTVRQVVSKANYPRDIAVIVGSEGGFDSSEVDNMLSMGVEVVTLGRRILRAETAPLYVLSVLHSLYGE